METLSEAALRLSEGRCGKGCESCPANSIRRAAGSGACLIRRIARIDNAAAQIDFLRRWMTKNPPKPGMTEGLKKTIGALIDECNANDDCCVCPMDEWCLYSGRIHLWSDPRKEDEDD